jgi:hypothetical protein
MAGKILEAKLVIGGKDETGGMLSAIQAKIAKMSASAAATSKNAQAVMRMSVNTAQAEASIGRNRSAMRDMVRGAAAKAASLTAPIAAAMTAHEIARASGARVHERARMEASGMTAKEIADSEALAANISSKFPAIAQTDAMYMLRNARSIVGSYQEAAEIMEPLAKLRIIAQANRPGEDISEDFDQLVKGLEIKGVTQHPEQFKDYMNGIAKGLNTFGDTLKPYQYYEMFKYGRQATAGLSEKFILGTAPTLAQELGGSSYGKVVSGFNATIVGNVMKHSALKDFQSLGLIAGGDFQMTKTGEAKGLKPGAHVQGWRLAQSDPNEWVKQYLLPALLKHGVTDKAKILQRISSLFQNQTVGQLVGILATQQSRIEKDLALLRGAKDLSAADLYQSKDPGVAWQGLKNSIEGAAGSMGSGLASAMAPAMNGLARAIAGYTARLSDMQGHDKFYPGEQSAGQQRANRWLNYMDTGILSNAQRDAIPLVQRNDVDWRNQHAMLKNQIANSDGGWLNSILGEPAGTAADRNRLALIDAAHAQRIASQNELADFQRNLPTNMDMHRSIDDFHATPGLLAFGLRGAAEGGIGTPQVTAKLDGQAQGSVAVHLEGSDALMQLLNPTSSVRTNAVGDLGTSSPDASPDQGGRASNGVSR